MTNWAFRQGEVEALAKADAEGGTIHDATSEVRAATTRFARSDLENLGRIYAARGVVRGSAMLDEFLVILGKWVALVRDVASADELERIYWTQLYSKVDVDQHGSLSSRCSILRRGRHGQADLH